MSIITTAERVGMKKGMEQGIEQGIEQGMREMIADILEIKFGVAGLALYDQVAQITGLEALREFRVGLKQTRSVAEALIHAHVKEQSSLGA